MQRIMAEHKELMTLGDSGIYSMMQDNLMEFSLRFYIREDSNPYDGLVFFIDVNLTGGYPIKPPRFRFRCPGVSYRIHPNLKPNGEVCLSILNTFSGERWSPCNTLRTVVLSIRSRFSDSPIRHEPGFERTPPDSEWSRAFDAHVAWAVLKSLDYVHGDSAIDEERHSMKSKLETRFWEHYMPRVEGVRGGFTTIHLPPRREESHVSNAL
jgi:ubiquitin-protein ligase